MKRFAVTITIGISAMNKKEAEEKIKTIVESGEYIDKKGKYTKVTVNTKPSVITLPF